MKTVVTITNFNNSGRYMYTLSKKGRVIRSMHDAGSNPEAAAAKAVDVAITNGESGYIILAPREVLDCIPVEIQKT